MPSSTSATQGQWFVVADHLMSEFDSLAPGRVIAAVALCRRRLTVLGLRGDGLAYATESMARALLSPKA
jgi:hypothetical protein